MFEPFTELFQNDTIFSTLRVLYYLSFVFVPIAIIDTAWFLWVHYRRAQFFAKQSYILLEIKLPKDIFKSPKAMEFCIDSLWSPFGEGNWYEKYWKGSVRSWFSLEIVSIDGVVHFYIWTKKGEKNKIEANLYSQYPGIEIFEVPDYTLPVVYDPEKNGMWVTEFKLTRPDVYPIKTYIDYGLDKDPKEEYKIDPMTPLIEFLGSLPRGNQAWLQIIIRAHKAEEKDPSKTFTKWKIWQTWSLKDKWEFLERKDFKWKESAQKEIDSILAKGKGEKDSDGKIIPGTQRFLTEDEQNTVKALGRSVSKKGFDVGMRMIYTAPKDIFNAGNIGGLIGGVTHFNSPLNGFAPTGTTSPKYSHLLLRRAYFHAPYKRDYFVLNTEELATLFHFPGGVSYTPTFTRVESRKGEAPANLPQ